MKLMPVPLARLAAFVLLTAAGSAWARESPWPINHAPHRAYFCGAGLDLAEQAPPAGYAAALSRQVTLHVRDGLQDVRSAMRRIAHDAQCPVLLRHDPAPVPALLERIELAR